MATNFRLRALPAERFVDLFLFSDYELANRGIRRMIVDEMPGFPCRVSLQDAEIGETVLLLSYDHLTGVSPYQASGPIFVRSDVSTATPAVNEVPEMLLGRLLSVRAYDSADMMINATVLDGVNLASTLQDWFDNSKVAYVHIHNAKPGCFNCVAERA